MKKKPFGNGQTFSGGPKILVNGDWSILESEAAKRDEYEAATMPQDLPKRIAILEEELRKCRQEPEVQAAIKDHIQALIAQQEATAEETTRKHKLEAPKSASKQVVTEEAFDRLDLFCFLLPPKVQKKIYQPALNDLKEDFLIKARHYHGKWAIRWLKFSFFIRTSWMVVGSLWTMTDGLRKVFGKLRKWRL